METTDERITDLEKRITAIEAQSQERQSALREFVDSWEEVLIQFANDFSVALPERFTKTE